MSKCGNSFLCYNDFATSRTVLTFSKSCVYTIGSNSRVNNLGVAECINYGLLNEYLVTNATMLALGKTCILTVGSNCCVNNLGMTKCCNRFLCLENLATDRAFLTFGKTGLLAGRLLGGNNLLGMICAEICITCITDIILGVFVGVTKCGNGFLCYNDFATNRAVLTFSKSNFGTSGCLCLVNYFSMTLCRSKFSITNGTNLCVKTICLITCSMTKCGNSFLCNLIVASVAMLSLCQTVFCTGGSLSTISNNIMIECRNLLLLYKDFATILT